MGYVKKEFFVQNETKTFLFLMREFGFSQSKAQRMIDKGHIFVNNEVLKDKASSVLGSVTVSIFEPLAIDVETLFENEDFAVLEKPSDLLTHPRKKDDAPSLLDAARAKFGADANCVHRLDAQTSGLVLVSKHKKSEAILKSMFAKKEITKEYMALVEGEIRDELLIDAPILQNGDHSELKVKVLIDKRGKESQTLVTPLKNIEGYTLVRVSPQTGRQHQIRAHLWHIGHRIAGDHLYGVERDKAERYLDGKLESLEKSQLFGARRLLLHAHYLSFEERKKYEFFSKVEFEELCYKELNFYKNVTSQ